MEQQQQQPTETATSYYNEHRKRSFFLSRLFVIISMVVLVITLSINISVLYSQDRTNTTTKAASNNPQQNLPALPEGCEYQTKEKGVIVVCPTDAPVVTPTLAANAQFPINIRLPKLPPECEYVNTSEGNSVRCEEGSAPIPTVAVRAYTSCFPGKTTNTLECTDTQNQKVPVPLPSLPGGCVYNLVGQNYFVVCKGM